MNKLNPRILTATLTVAVGGLLLAPVFADGAPAAAPAAAAPWKAVAASGAVEHRSDAAVDAWHKVRRGDALQPLSEVRTGRRGRATLTREASVIILDPATQLQLPEGQPADRPAKVFQNSGSAVYQVKHGQPFEVETPYLVAGVKGTVFGVTVADGQALVSVEQGAVEIRSPLFDGPLEVVAGEAVRIDAERGDADLMRHDRGDRAGDRRGDADVTRMARRNLHRLGDSLDRGRDDASGDREGGEDDDHDRLDPTEIAEDRQGDEDLDEDLDLDLGLGLGDVLDDGQDEDDTREGEINEKVREREQGSQNNQGDNGSN